MIYENKLIIEKEAGIKFANDKKKSLKSEVNRLKDRLASVEKSNSLKIKELNAKNKKSKSFIEYLKRELKFRRKILSLLKKHSYLNFEVNENNVKWVGSDDFDSDWWGYQGEGDPYEEHFTDDYENAYYALCFYVELHEGTKTAEDEPPSLWA
tara:strand:- start:47 stop:505 length:459 start_codon:yes stop_codon:yes gene_type:complete